MKEGKIRYVLARVVRSRSNFSNSYSTTGCQRIAMEVLIIVNFNSDLDIVKSILLSSLLTSPYSTYTEIFLSGFSR